MLKKLILACALMTVTGAVPAFAQESCATPVAPAPVDGAAVTQPVMVAAIKTAKDYIAASDVYQQCVTDYIAAAKAQAARDKKPFDASIEQAEMTKIAANQASKEKVGGDINTSIGAYKKAHPPA